MHEIWSHFGPGLAAVLTSQIAGVCLRSDLEYFAKPITAMMRVDPRSREWFEQAVNELAQLNGPSMEDAKIFLQKIRMQVDDPFNEARYRLTSITQIHQRRSQKSH